MRKVLIISLTIIIASNLSAQQKQYRLWYRQPAKDWNEALPIGNGRLGAMIFGRPDVELIQLNEQTLWTGGPPSLNPNPDAAKYLQPVRTALFNDSIQEAIGLLKKMQGPNSQIYQPLGDIIIRQQLDGEVTGYTRELNISDATATVNFVVNGIGYSREMFCSHPDQVIMIRLRSTERGRLNFTVDVSHPLKYTKMAEANALVLKGKARTTNYDGGDTSLFAYEDASHCNGMRFQFRIVAVVDGTIHRLKSSDTSITVSKGTEAILFVTAATSFNGFDKCPDIDGKDEAAAARRDMDLALEGDYRQIYHRHVADYHKYFDRVVLSLTDDMAPNIPTDERLARYKQGKSDLSLEEMYYQFGRYLLISCSRPGGAAANLQGLWNYQVRPPWRSNYTTNINLQMNYWMAQPCNLPEMEQPLIEQISHMARNGVATAKNYYDMRGWATHHNSDIWAQTNPVGEGSGDPKWANWAMGSPWLSQHLYERYQFTADKKYLQQVAYPIMKNAAEFCLDWLVEKNGVLVTAPSTSPENVYIHPAGFKGTVTISSAMDMEIIWDLFTNIIEADSILNIDKDFAALLRQKRGRLNPLKIGKKGNVVEWYDDWEDEDPQHRHVSHAFALHPGREISPLIDMKFANALRRTLEIRGDGGTGWSKAWKVNFWARLLDGDHAYKMYGELLKNSTLINLFDTHPPFQIDGNFGATSGVTEMLLQSHLNMIQLLPALPAAWKQGHVKGLVARGNFEVEEWWKEGRLTHAIITSRRGGQCRIRINGKFSLPALHLVSTPDEINGIPGESASFKTSAGKRYEIKMTE